MSRRLLDRQAGRRSASWSGSGRASMSGSRRRSSISQRLGVRHLRTGISWADYHRAGVQRLVRLAAAEAGRPLRAAALRALRAAVALPQQDHRRPAARTPRRMPTSSICWWRGTAAISRRSSCGTSPTTSPTGTGASIRSGMSFALMIVQAAHWMRRKGKRTVLGGMCPLDLNWLRLMAERRALAEIDVVGLHGFPGTWESASTSWRSWPEQIEAVRRLLAEHGLAPGDLDHRDRLFDLAVRRSSTRSMACSRRSRRRSNGSTGTATRTCTRRSPARKAGTSTSATTISASSAPAASRSCCTACWPRAASSSRARSTRCSARRRRSRAGRGR